MEHFQIDKTKPIVHKYPHIGAQKAIKNIFLDDYFTVYQLKRFEYFSSKFGDNEKISIFGKVKNLNGR